MSDWHSLNNVVVIPIQSVKSVYHWLLMCMCLCMDASVYVCVHGPHREASFHTGCLPAEGDVFVHGPAEEQHGLRIYDHWGRRTWWVSAGQECHTGGTGSTGRQDGYWWVNTPSGQSEHLMCWSDCFADSKHVKYSIVYIKVNYSLTAVNFSVFHWYHIKTKLLTLQMNTDCLEPTATLALCLHVPGSFHSIFLNCVIKGFN